MKLSTEGVKL